MRRPRLKPYTVLGLKRLPCCRCAAKPSHVTWQICADGRVMRPICAACDVELNELVMRWAFGDMREQDLSDYRRKVLGD